MRAGSRKAGHAAAAVALGTLLVISTAGEARGSPGWNWPVKGGVITPYSNDDANPYAGGLHRGIDIAAAVGTPVRAARAGHVTYAGALGYSGLTVAVRTVDGYLTSYLHLSAVAVRRGETVGRGARLGEAGTTGRRSRAEPHLHFGVRRAGAEHHYVDPLSLLPPLPGTPPAAPASPAPARVPVAPQVEPARVLRAPAAVPSTRRPVPRPARAPRHLPLPVPVRRPAPAPAGAPVAQAPVATPDHGKLLALGGLVLLVLASFGGCALRVGAGAARALSGRFYGAIGRALRARAAALKLPLGSHRRRSPATCADYRPSTSRASASLHSPTSP
jgi:Peptidase family M23